MVRPYTLSEPFFGAEAAEHVDYLSAIQEFAQKRYLSLAGRVISQLQRFPHSDIFAGETKGMKSVWDEYCWYQTNFSSDSGMLSAAFEDTVSSFILGVIQQLDPTEAVLLTCAAAEEQDNMPYYSEDIIADVLREMLAEAASLRDLSRFEVY